MCNEHDEEAERQQASNGIDALDADGEGPLTTKIEVILGMKITKVTRIPLEVDHAKATHYACIQAVDENGHHRRVMVGWADISHPGPNDVDMSLDRIQGSGFFTEEECLQRRMNKPLFPPQGTPVPQATTAERLEKIPHWAEQVAGPVAQGQSDERED